MRVVFLHGLARSHRSLSRLRNHVEKAGFPTWARTYPSRQRPVAELASQVAEWLDDELPGEPLLAVTHSLGGILLRQLATRLPWQGALMLAPPNGGSRLASHLVDNPLFGWFFGPAGLQMARPETWPEPPRPFIVVAGTLPVTLGNPISWASRGLGWLPPDVRSDGTVAVDETRLPGMQAFHEVEASHTWIMNDPMVMRITLDFVRERFASSTPRPR